MDKWERAHGLFGYELASGLIVALVVTGTVSKLAATKLIGDLRDHLCENYPDLKAEFQEIAAKNTGQVELLSVQFDRMMKDDRED